MTPQRASAGLTAEWRNFELTLSDGVARIVLDRPERLNALTFDVYADLRDLMHELPSRDDARAVLLTGRGRGFCSGGDVEEIIAELREMEPRELLEFTRLTGAVVRAMRECPLPIVAAINGVAAGAGAVLALASDFRLLARSSSLAFLFTKVGLAGADMGSAYLLPRIVGLGAATRLLMLGERIGAEEAHQLGLGELVDDDTLDDEAEALAARLAGGPALAYSATKMLLAREQDMGLSGAIELEAVMQALLMRSRDHGEFFRAWSEDRPPEWAGR